MVCLHKGLFIDKYRMVTFDLLPGMCDDPDIEVIGDDVLYALSGKAVAFSGLDIIGITEPLYSSIWTSLDVLAKYLLDDQVIVKAEAETFGVDYPDPEKA